MCPPGTDDEPGSTCPVAISATRCSTGEIFSASHFLSVTLIRGALKLFYLPELRQLTWGCRPVLKLSNGRNHLGWTRIRVVVVRCQGFDVPPFEFIHEDNPALYERGA